MSESMNKHKSHSEEDVMSLLSVGEDFDMTREEENTLLESDDMAIDSPIKRRKPIVFNMNDTKDSTAEDNNEDNEIRDKFRTERTSINFTLNESKNRREIPDSLDFISNDFRKSFKNTKKKSRKRLNRQNNRFIESELQMSQRLNRFNQNTDLRQFIKNNNNNNQRNRNNLLANQSMINTNLLFQNPVMNLTPLMKWQLDLGILDTNAIQNQIVMNALLAQNQPKLFGNPLANRLGQMSGNSLNLQNNNITNSSAKTKEDIQITIINNNRPTNSTKTNTKPQIRCLVSKDLNECEIIDDMPSAPMETNKRPQLKTLFSKHLSEKVSHSKAKTELSDGIDMFSSALAEAEVGVDNDYLTRMQEMEKKRAEIKRLKEERRLAMADERLQSAEETKLKITGQRRLY